MGAQLPSRLHYIEQLSKQNSPFYRYDVLRAHLEDIGFGLRQLNNMGDLALRQFRMRDYLQASAPPVCAQRQGIHVWVSVAWRVPACD